MPVIVSRDRIDAVKAALGNVASNGQAVAACHAATAAAGKLGKILSAEGGAIRKQAVKDLDEYGKKVSRWEKDLTGSPTLAVSSATWAKAKDDIFRLYMLAFTMETTLGPGIDLGDTWSDALASAAADLPKTIGEAARVAAQVAQTVVTETAKVGGALVWGVFSGAWPLVLVAAAIGVGYLVLRKKIPVLP